MIINDQLLKLFVLVPSTVENFNGATVSGAANEYRLFFEQSTGLIWAKGLSFGGNGSELTTTVNTLIGSDTNKSIREIAGEVLTEAMNLSEDADTTISNLTEVLEWFEGLSENEKDAVALINEIGKKGTTQAQADEYNATLQGALNSTDTLTAEQAAAYNTAVDGASKAEGDTLSDDEAKAYNATLTGAKTATASTGLYKEIENAVTNVDLSSVNTRIGALETTVGDSNSGLVKSVADINTSMGGLTTRVTALEAFDPWENYVAPVTPSEDPEPEP